MSIEITCLQCGANHKVNNRLAGKRVRCPECETAVHVPELVVPVEAEPVALEGATPEEAEPVAVEPEAVEVVAVEAEPATVQPVAVASAIETTSKASVGAVSSGSDTMLDEGDDDDDDLNLRSPTDDGELDMTPMVDVTFLLLIFFVVTASFQLQKSIMMPRQQTDAPSTSSVEEDPEELDQVELQIDERGSFLVLAADWESETPGKQGLISKLKEAMTGGDAGAKLIIKVHEQCKLQSLVDGMDAGTIAGYTELEVTQVEDFD